MIKIFQAPQLNSKEDLLRELHQERRAAEAAAAMKKKLDEQRLLVRKYQRHFSVYLYIFIRLKKINLSQRQPLQ